MSLFCSQHRQVSHLTSCASPIGSGLGKLTTASQARSSTWEVVMLSKEVWGKWRLGSQKKSLRICCRFCRPSLFFYIAEPLAFGCFLRNFSTFLGGWSSWTLFWSIMNQWKILSILGISWNKTKTKSFVIKPGFLLAHHILCIYDYVCDYMNMYMTILLCIWLYDFMTIHIWTLICGRVSFCWLTIARFLLWECLSPPWVHPEVCGVHITT